MRGFRSLGYRSGCVMSLAAPDPRPPASASAFRGSAAPTGQFDLVLVFGILLLSIAVAWSARSRPEWFTALLVADLWLLGYHHVIATFTRFAGGGHQPPNRAVLMLWLPPIVFAATAMLAFAGGIVAVVTLYFYWQWFHYVRQSWGISRYLRGKASLPSERSPRLAHAAFWSIPVVGLLFRSAEDHGAFLFLPIRMIPVPDSVVWIAAAIAVVLLLLWLASEIRRGIATKRTAIYFAYLCSHHLVFAFSYVAIDDLNWGWLTINVWHNAQYLLFVWSFNVHRFAKPQGPGRNVLAWLCAPRRVVAYFSVTFLVTTMFYLTLERAISWVEPGLALAAMVVVFQAVNFHHYIVDSLIWKRPKGVASPAPQVAHG